MTSNLLIILSDEHNPHVMGCAGHPEIQTPNLDRLARKGTRFTNAVCASPICVPARASIATGQPVFRNECWDNVLAFDGKMPSWHRVLRDAGHEVTSIGKLHYRGWDGDDYGFTESLLPMHIHGGRGEVKMLLRNPPATLGDGSNMLRSAKAGESDYTQYDNSICDTAVDWLERHSVKKNAEPAAKPWVLLVSMVAPHFPLTAPPDFFEMYEGRDLQIPSTYERGVGGSAHPFLRQYAEDSKYNLHFSTDADIRRALTGYYALVSFLDSKIGRLLATLQKTGLESNTRVMYLSDHGDNLGGHGLWGKSTMYSGSVGIPMILKGAGIPENKIDPTPVSQLDVFDTVLDAVGVSLEKSTAFELSCSLLKPLDQARTVFSEYHTIGSRAGVFMVQNQSFKYVYYCDHPPQLFDLANDPGEVHNLAALPQHQPLVAEWHARLLDICDPQKVDAAAKSSQADAIEFYGGDAAIRAGIAFGGYTPAPSR